MKWIVFISKILSAVLICLMGCDKSEDIPVELASIATKQFLNITYNSVQGVGKIHNDGGGLITDCGICYNKTGNPTIQDYKVTYSGDSDEFACTLQNLSSYCSYYAKAYAQNSAGISYGEEISFRTPSGDSSFTDSRDGKNYKTVRIGDHWWMAENLNFQTIEGSGYYANDPANEIYGRLYNYNAAMNACPTGWHLPSDDEWKVLEIDIGLSLQSLDDLGGRGTDEGLKLLEGGDTGFNAKLGGGTYNNDIGIACWFWTSTKTYEYYAYCRSINNYTGTSDYGKLIRTSTNIIYKFSVRCIKDQL